MMVMILKMDLTSLNRFDYDADLISFYEDDRY